MMREFWQGKKVLVTGQTGFKGAWLAFWLADMGAQVSGIALEPHTKPNLYNILEISKRGKFVTADINNREVVSQLLTDEKPEIVIHMAAQAIVRASYLNPVETFATNVLGTVAILDAIRMASGVRAVLIVTSDKVYENKEWTRGYRETDHLGGQDPYSASKGCTELATAAMKRSFFGEGKHPACIATVRAGNVIGGGDWSKDRLVPDIVRGCLSGAGVVTLRNPDARRPWQHVLDPLSAYLKLAELLYHFTAGYDEAWNIGPDEAETYPVREVANALVKALGVGQIKIAPNGDAFNEANLLVLDCAKTKARLGWHPIFDFTSTISMTADWYGAWVAGRNMIDITSSQIRIIEAASKGQAVGSVND